MVSCGEGRVGGVRRRLRSARTPRACLALWALMFLWSAGCTGPEDGVPTEGASSDRTQPNGRFVAMGDDAVRDTRTGLEWTGRDSGRDLTWPDAESYCGTLALGSRTGWRLPEIRELEDLFDRDATQPCGDRPCHLDAAIRLTGPYVWSATGEASTRFYRDFQFGTSLAPHIGPRLMRRVLCVRGAAPAPPTVRHGPGSPR